MACARLLRRWKRLSKTRMAQRWRKYWTFSRTCRLLVVSAPTRRPRICAQKYAHLSTYSPIDCSTPDLLVSALYVIILLRGSLRGLNFKGELEQGNMLKSHAQSQASAPHRAPPGSMYRLSQCLCISVSNFQVVSVLVCVMWCDFDIDTGMDVAGAI